MLVRCLHGDSHRVNSKIVEGYLYLAEQGGISDTFNISDLNKKFLGIFGKNRFKIVKEEN